MYSAEGRFLRSQCTNHYRRITRTFAKIDGIRFRELTAYIQQQINAMGNSLESELPLHGARGIEELLARVLPPDDSSIQFSHAGAGLSRDLKQTTAELFDRYVERYAGSGETSRREDEEVWRVFREPLLQHHVGTIGAEEDCGAQLRLRVPACLEERGLASV